MDDNRVRDFLRNPYVPLVAAIAFAVVALHEWHYRDAHPHAYGPAVQIVIAAVAGMVVGLTASAFGFQNDIYERRMDRLWSEVWAIRRLLEHGPEDEELGSVLDRCVVLEVEVEEFRDRLERLEAGDR